MLASPANKSSFVSVKWTLLGSHLSKNNSNSKDNNQQDVSHLAFSQTALVWFEFLIFALFCLGRFLSVLDCLSKDVKKWIVWRAAGISAQRTWLVKNDKKYQKCKIDQKIIKQQIWQIKFQLFGKNAKWETSCWSLSLELDLFCALLIIFGNCLTPQNAKSKKKKPFSAAYQTSLIVQFFGAEMRPE